MRIYIFRSEARPELQAFADDRWGRNLPRQFAPWHVTGVITEDRHPPFRLPRREIEAAIAANDYQLWRIKRNGTDKSSD